MINQIAEDRRKAVTEYLEGFVSEERKRKLKQVLKERTRHITVMLENIYQPHNASAVLRSCDGFGIQDVHIVENSNEFSMSKGVTIGADKWITKYRYNKEDNGIENTEQCLSNLKDQGYRLLATTPHSEDVNIQDMDVRQKTALLFGTELEGLSARALEMADGYVKIPMYGFSESLNLSVSAAICLSYISQKIRNDGAEVNWQLDDHEKEDLYLQWLIKSVREPELLLTRFKKENMPDAKL